MITEISVEDKSDKIIDYYILDNLIYNKISKVNHELNKQNINIDNIDENIINTIVKSIDDIMDNLSVGKNTNIRYKLYQSISDIFSEKAEEISSKIRELI